MTAGVQGAELVKWHSKSRLNDGSSFVVESCNVEVVVRETILGKRFGIFRIREKVDIVASQITEADAESVSKIVEGRQVLFILNIFKIELDCQAIFVIVNVPDVVVLVHVRLVLKGTLGALSIVQASQVVVDILFDNEIWLKG